MRRDELPGIEVFYSDEYPAELEISIPESKLGWYWWSCQPGCLPDGEPNGPFATEEEAWEDADDYRRA